MPTDMPMDLPIKVGKYQRNRVESCRGDAKQYLFKLKKKNTRE